MSSDVHEIKKEVRIYLIVFVSLLFLTMVTVAVSYLHLSITAAVALALAIASIKATLVACYFMHLISEKALIYIILIFTLIFFLSILLLPLAGYYDNIKGGGVVA